MSTSTPKQHTDREYEAELAMIREQLLLMAATTESMIASAVRAFLDRDVALAGATIENDRAVNKLEVAIDEMCLRVLAKRQPVASDLRFLTIAMKMVTDLERCGDLAVDICERAIAVAGKPPFDTYADLAKMATRAQRMIKDAIDAFVRGDEAAARAVIDRDADVDELYQAVCAKLVDLMRADPDKVDRANHGIAVAKYVERMADHGTNLAEQVIFMLKGKDVRHPGKLSGAPS
jgi:phosphate transport system protein